MRHTHKLDPDTTAGPSQSHGVEPSQATCQSVASSRRRRLGFAVVREDGAGAWLHLLDGT